MTGREFAAIRYFKGLRMKEDKYLGLEMILASWSDCSFVCFFPIH